MKGQNNVMKPARKLEYGDLSQCIVCNHNETVVETARILRDCQSRHLLVLDDQKKPVGVISTVDICNRIVAEEKNPATIKAKDMMTKGIETIPVDASLPEALQKMGDKNISFLPVVDEKGSLVGVLEFANVLKAMATLEKKLNDKYNKDNKTNKENKKDTKKKE